MRGFLGFMVEGKDGRNMMNGFEVGVGFCDYGLVEYVWNVGFEMKSMENIEKGMLRGAFEDVL
ncbi:asparagine synthase-related protein, partial [Bacillus thuringiensis]|uniref:asparagine synthase-related protein n=1 Tax=Bacillus thuringiensis TaxID=1428 RepID=UPI003D6C974E